MPTASCCATTKAKSSSIPRLRMARRFPRHRKKLKSRSWSSFRTTKTRRGGAATKRKRLQRRDAEDAESRRAFSLTTDGHGSRRAGRIRARREFRELTRIQLAIIRAIRVQHCAPLFPIRVHPCPSVVKKSSRKGTILRDGTAKARRPRANDFWGTRFGADLARARAQRCYRYRI